VTEKGRDSNGGMCARAILVARATLGDRSCRCATCLALGRAPVCERVVDVSVVVVGAADKEEEGGEEEEEEEEEECVTTERGETECVEESGALSVRLGGFSVVGVLD
jgi:hypothetical protein